jgi:copper(I)-binding protein
MRLSWPAIAVGAVVAALGAAGLIRGAVSQSDDTAGPSASAAGPIAVTGAYVRANVPPAKDAAVYFTVYNTTATDDRLVSVETGAGESAVVQVADAGGALHAAPAGVLVRAHGSLVLAPGKGRVMIEGVFGTLKPGQSVDLELDFRQAGPISVVAQVKAASS